MRCSSKRVALPLQCHLVSAKASFIVVGRFAISAIRMRCALEGNHRQVNNYAYSAFAPRMRAWNLPLGSSRMIDVMEARRYLTKRPLTC